MEHDPVLYCGLMAFEVTGGGRGGRVMNDFSQQGVALAEAENEEPGLPIDLNILESDTARAARFAYRSGGDL